MYWLPHPPYVRWTLGVVVFLMALWLDLKPPSTVEHPFLAHSVPAGAEISEADVDWRPIPAGLMNPAEPSGFAARSLEAGDPLLASDLRSVPPPPVTWWELEALLPQDVPPGAELRLVLYSTTGDEPTIVDAIVTRPGGGSDNFGVGEQPGMIAVPPEAAAGAALAIAADQYTVLVSAGGR